MNNKISRATTLNLRDFNPEVCPAARVAIATTLRWMALNMVKSPAAGRRMIYYLEVQQRRVSLDIMSAAIIGASAIWGDAVHHLASSYTDDDVQALCALLRILRVAVDHTRDVAHALRRNGMLVNLCGVLTAGPDERVVAPCFLLVNAISSVSPLANLVMLPVDFPPVLPTVCDFCDHVSANEATHIWHASALILKRVTALRALDRVYLEDLAGIVARQHRFAALRGPAAYAAWCRLLRRVAKATLAHEDDADALKNIVPMRKMLQLWRKSHGCLSWTMCTREVAHTVSWMAFNATAAVFAHCMEYSFVCNVAPDAAVADANADTDAAFIEVLHMAECLMHFMHDSAAAPKLVETMLLEFGSAGRALHSTACEVLAALKPRMFTMVLATKGDVRLAYYTAAQLIERELEILQPAPAAASASASATAVHEPLLEPQQRLQQLSANNLCIACFREQRQFCFLTCGHIATCLGCTAAIMAVCGQKCPACRRVCTGVQRVFVV
jgi:hypothetical protein